MRIITALALVFSVAAADQYYPDRFEEGYTFSACNTSIFSEPDNSSGVLAKIPPGELLEIIEFTGETFMADSCPWGWYEARYKLGDSEFTGFVLDRDLAFGHLSLGTGEVDTLFLYRLTGFEPDSYCFRGEALIVSGGRILDSAQHRPAWTSWDDNRLYDYDVTVAHADPAGLSGVSDLIALSFNLWACGYENRDDLLAWTADGRLIPGPRATWISEAGVFHYLTEVRLPTDSGGVQDQVIHRIVWEEYISYEVGYEMVDEEIRPYIWTGDAFELSEED